MPLYEYLCPNDGTFERMQKFSDPPLTACPTCGAPVEKLLSAPAIQFKGSGWYITDYARKSQGGAETGKDKPKGDAAKADGGKGDGGKAEGGSAGGSASPAAASSPAATAGTDKKK